MLLSPITSYTSSFEYFLCLGFTGLLGCRLEEGRKYVGLACCCISRACLFNKQMNKKIKFISEI